MIIKSGSIVLHKPTKEEWFVLGVCPRGQKLCAAGYPPTIADVSDCVFVKQGDDLTADEIRYRNATFGGGWR